MRNLKMIVSGAATPDTGKAHAQKTGNSGSVVNWSGIGKLAFVGKNWEDQFTDGLRRAGAWSGEGKPHYVSDRMIRRAAERAAAKAARKGGAK